MEPQEPEGMVELGEVVLAPTEELIASVQVPVSAPDTLEISGAATPVDQVLAIVSFALVGCVVGGWWIWKGLRRPEVGTE